ncbi:MAG: recombinase family protein [Clostridium paraputrificum]
MSKIYGYARVSSRIQVEGNSLEAQEKLLRENGATEIYLEQYTGKDIKRPVFDKLIRLLEKGDTLMVTKIDRLARSLTQGSELVKKLIDEGINVHILNIGKMDNTSGSKLIRNIFFAFAEFERDMIIERTQEGKAIAKTKEGFKEGRPRQYSDKVLDHAISLLSINGGKMSYNEVTELTGISKSTLIRYNNKKKIYNS